MNPRVDGRPVCLLIVDDERDNRELLGVVLTWEGFVCMTVASGAEALAAVAQSPPDLILLDVMMPGMNGYDVTARLKGDPATKSIPIILVTAMADGEAKERGLCAGAEDFLAKPIDRDMLVPRIHRLLHTRYASYHESGPR
jgi:CheY-like chemotaxis protein